jgi:hypothetical protein
MTPSTFFRPLVLDHAAIDVRSGWALFAVGAGFLALGHFGASDVAPFAYAAGAISMLVGGAGAAILQASKLKADRVGIWHHSLLGVKRGVAWSDVSRIEAPGWIEIVSERGERIRLDPKRAGMASLSALILQRVSRRKMTRAAYVQLRRYAREHERTAIVQRAAFAAKRNARMSFADRSGISS